MRNKHGVGRWEDTAFGADSMANSGKIAEEMRGIRIVVILKDTAADGTWAEGTRRQWLAL